MDTSQPTRYMTARRLVDTWPELFNYNTLSYWRQIGVGPKWAKLGRRVVYRESDVQQWIDAQFAAATATR